MPQQPFLSEIDICSFNFAPRGFALCNGQLLAINTNQALFSLLGTTYGGDGRTTFGLPNLQGRVPIMFGNGYTLGLSGGEETHTLTSSEMPTHNHTVGVDANTGSTGKPGGAFLANAAPTQMYTTTTPGATAVAMSPSMVSSTGSTQAHENRQPYAVLCFVIALQGIYPSQS